jgi:hypothetical protein
MHVVEDKLVISDGLGAAIEPYTIMSDGSCGGHRNYDSPWK